MFNTGKLKKVNNLISAANSCVDNRDVKGARTALSQANDILKKIHGNKTQELLDWITAAEKLNNLAKELHEAELTPEELQEEKKLAAKAKVENAKDKAEIDSNPEYVKWMNYFWEHRIENDETMQQKYVPLLMECYEEFKERDASYEGVKRVIAEEGTKRWWNSEGLGVLAFGIEPYTYFNFLCKNVIREEFSCARPKLTDIYIDTPEASYFRDYLHGYEKKYARPEEYTQFLKDITDNEKYPICLNNKRISENSIKFVADKWQEQCDSDIKKTDTLNRDKRFNALKESDKFFTATYGNEEMQKKYAEYHKSLFELAVEYFNFIEKENN